MMDHNPTTQGLVHPEQGGEREVFLGNFEPRHITKLEKEWATLRVGKIAYKDDGAPYSETMLPAYRPLPVFADRNEALAKHYELHTFAQVPISEDLLREMKLLPDQKSV